jgi:hypothetical protein
MNTRISRLFLTVTFLFGLLFVPALSFAHDPRTGIHPRMMKSGAGPHTWPKVAENARAVGITLLNDFPGALDPQARPMIRESLHQFDKGAGMEYDLVVTPPVELTARQKAEGVADAHRLLEASAKQIAKALQLTPNLVEANGDRSFQVSRNVSLTFRSGILVIHREQAAGAAPDFALKKVDLGSSHSLSVDLGDVGGCFCVLQFENVPLGTSQFSLIVRAQSKTLGKIKLTTTVPPQFRVQFKLRDNEGNPLTAAVGLYAASGELVIPLNALDFSFGGDPYQPKKYREQYNTHYWPGEEGFKRSFFVRNEFTVDLPAGSYRLIASKGPEYLPVDRTIDIGEHHSTAVNVDLKRWIDMSARGWHGGDSHVHFTRMDDAANQHLITWVDAEGLRIGNVLLMGDARETYFPQYAFGKSGRFVQNTTALVPGQEDPRTNVIGHTIFLNLQKPIRQPEGLYYFYESIFDEAHHQGALGGYAHVVGDLFFVHRDMTLNIPRNKVDFVEICEFGEVVPDVYYEFLNLGFKIAAVGGSDAPWGGTVGDSRVYAYTGKNFDPDDWFAAVKKGSTFVTVGPQLEFTVDGSIPGDELTPKKGTILKVHAKEMAGYLNFPLEQLEIVVNGEVIRSAKATDQEASLDFEIPADHSFWIAARTKGAHTSPVYVTVDGKRHWSPSAVPGLLAKREKQLKEIEELVEHPDRLLPPGRRQNWEHPTKLQRSTENLRQSIREARAIYQRLDQEYEREKSAH